VEIFIGQMASKFFLSLILDSVEVLYIFSIQLAVCVECFGAKISFKMQASFYFFWKHRWIWNICVYIYVYTHKFYCIIVMWNTVGGSEVWDLVWNGDGNNIYTGLKHQLAVRCIRIHHCMSRCFTVQLNEFTVEDHLSRSQNTEAYKQRNCYNRVFCSKRIFYKIRY
jgi:hypothetical protein